MLSGLKGVRSAIFSQVATHYTVTMTTKLKAGLHLPEVLKTLGTDSLTAYGDTHADWKERLLNAILKVYPFNTKDTARAQHVIGSRLCMACDTNMIN